MSIELNLRFPDETHVIIRLGPEDDGSGPIPFANPMTAKDLADIQWYVETYGAHSLAEPDDEAAQRIKGKLPVWGKKLFTAVFTLPEARRRIYDFQKAEDETRLLTVSAEAPEILVLPWELLHDPAPGGGFLFMETPRISIRRRVSGAAGGRTPFTARAKDTLRLLFVVSRPEGVGFLDPRADALPILDAIDEHAPGRVVCEFLRPATLDGLLERLEDTSQPAVDIVHFDGHGVFDRKGGLPKQYAESHKSRRSEHLREGPSETREGEWPANTGYLLFETEEGKPHFVSAGTMGENLHRHKVALVILSACQSAAVGGQVDKGEGEETKGAAMGSVAGRLTATGIPSVLAMTHSVLVYTTQALFGQFYKELARQRGIGEALDNARRWLSNHPEKYEIQRGSERVMLKLDDWFLPALYQPGADGPLLTALPAVKAMPRAVKTNVRKAPEAGFFGRKRELWEIERWYAGRTRRITITGFGGQGKTALAQEVGRWLGRAGMFEATVFVDYAAMQASDAVAVAVANIGGVLGETLIDAGAVTKALSDIPTLVILDNLEALGAEPLQALLSAAVGWSEAGGSRVLCTTRRTEFGHADYRVEGTLVHRRIQLDGLGRLEAPDDALDWCAALMKLPPAPSVAAPKREALIGLFDQVRFHPLSIRVLALQLKTRRAVDLGERLEQLLSGKAVDVSGTRNGLEDTPAGLVASLWLSLEQLDQAALKALPKLGVFQGGAFEDDLIAITGLGDDGKRERLEGALAAIEGGKAPEWFAAQGEPVPDAALLQSLTVDLRKALAELPPPKADLWPSLRRQLEAAALIEAEGIPGLRVPYLRFHPTLAPMLWAELGQEDRTQLATAHRQRYYALSGYLYRDDSRNPHQVRAISRRELPNLLYAVHAALDTGDPDAVEFADSVNRFLDIFGLKQEQTALSAKARAAAGEVGSQAWVLAESNRGEQLFDSGQVAAAMAVFQGILKQLGDKPTFERVATFGHIGRCHSAGGRPNLAVLAADEGIAVCEQLEQTETVKRLRGVLLTDKADGLRHLGKYPEARQAYEGGLKIDEELKDLRGQGVTHGQLGTLAMWEGNLKEAAKRHQTALALFQRLGEPAAEAVAWHQLGLVFERAKMSDEAERHYREAARINEQLGDLVRAASTWNQLAIVNEMNGKPDLAEMWYRKELEVDRLVGNAANIAIDLSNLAGVLLGQRGRLTEARTLAEEALTLKRTLDPGAAKIWTTHNVLAQIADKEAAENTDFVQRAKFEREAREYRREARTAKWQYPPTRQELKKHTALIVRTVAAVAQPSLRSELEQALAQREKRGWTNLVAATRRILDGERHSDALFEGLDSEDSMVVESILQGIANPETIRDLTEAGSSENT